MTSEIQAMLTVRYGEFRNPMPSQDLVASMAPLERRAAIGRSFNFPVILGLPHGVQKNDDASAFTLASVISPVVKEATLSGSEMAIIDNVAYADVFATMNGISNGGGQGGAYMDVWDYKTKGLMQSGELYRELDLLYGPGPSSTAAGSIGVVSSSISGANLAAPQVVNLTRASWSGLWTMMIGAKVDIYQSDLATLRASGVTVTSIAESTNRLTLTKATSGATVAAGDVILVSTGLDVSMYGLEAISANTGSIFGIDASIYPQWKVTQHPVGSTTLTRASILGLASKLTSRYKAGETNGAKLLVSGAAMADLIDEASELQRFLDEGEVRVQGATAVNYKTPIGRIDAQVHPYMKQGIAMLLPNGETKRVGATDLTFDNGKNEWFYLELGTQAGSQLRIYSNQAILYTSPWKAAYLTGIQSTYDTSPA